VKTFRGAILSVQEDEDAVDSALRFGWSVAEFRGRSQRENLTAPRREPLSRQSDCALPLRTERTSSELLLETKRVFVTIAEKLNIGGATGSGSAGTLEQVSDAFKQLLASNPPDHAGSDLTASRVLLERAIYNLDSEAQDVFASRSQSQATAYQLGRGLAECYWALGATPSADSWRMLMGDARCSELSRLAGRLSSYFDPVVIPAVVGTLQVWNSVAATPEWRGDGRGNADRYLYMQVRRWYELLIVRQPPTTFVSTSARAPRKSQMRAAWTSLKAVWPQLLLGTGALVTVIVAIALTAQGSASVLSKSVLWALGIIGISASTAQARLKSSAQDLLHRLARAMYTDLIIVAVTVVPPPPGKRRLRDSQLSSIASERTVYADLEALRASGAIGR
jgi:hypothetical protein